MYAYMCVCVCVCDTKRQYTISWKKEIKAPNQFQLLLVNVYFSRYIYIYIMEHTMYYRSVCEYIYIYKYETSISTQNTTWFRFVKMGGPGLKHKMGRADPTIK